MNNLNSIIEFMTAEAQQIEARAVAEKAAFANNLINGIKAAFGIGDNDNSPPTPPTDTPTVVKASPIVVKAITAPVVAKAPQKSRGGKKKFDDAVFINVLTTNFQYPADVVAALANVGVIASTATVYSRMDRLTKTLPGSIEQQASPLAWRIKGRENAPATIKNVVKVASKARYKKVASNNPAARFRTSDRGQLFAANDQLIAANDLAISNPITSGLHHGDCLELMKRIPSGTIPLILVDPPYGTTKATTPDKLEKIDVALDHEAVWAEYRRILTPTGTVVMFGSQPFTNEMTNFATDYGLNHINNNIWLKNVTTGFAHCRNKPLKNYEDIMIFSKGKMGHARKDGKPINGTTIDRMTFNPWQAVEVTRVNRRKSKTDSKSHTHVTDYSDKAGEEYESLSNCPRMVLQYDKEHDAAHSFQKPQLLLNDLIRMYSNEDDIVLDTCVGGGSTAVAAINANRRWIAMEKTNFFYKVSKERIEATLTQKEAA